MGSFTKHASKELTRQLNGKNIHIWQSQVENEHYNIPITFEQLYCTSHGCNSVAEPYYTFVEWKQ